MGVGGCDIFGVGIYGKFSRRITNCTVSYGVYRVNRVSHQSKRLRCVHTVLTSPV